MDTSRLTNINDIVSEALLISEVRKVQYFRFLQIATKGLQEISLFFYGGTMRTVKLEMDSNYTVPLPNDFLDYVAVGVPMNGELHTFTKDDKLIITTSTVNGVQIQDQTQGEGIVKYQGLVWGYGAKGGKNDYLFKIDLNAGIIAFNGAPQKEVQLWYNSSGVSLDGDTMVHSGIKDALVSYIVWKYYFYKKDPKEKLFEEDYVREIYKVKTLRDSNTFDEWKDFLYSLLHQSPGR